MEKDSQEALLRQLSDGVQSLHLNISAETIQRLLDYLIEFQRWNKTHNLSSIHDLNQSVTLHLLDSLAVLPYLDKYIDYLPKSEGVFTLADLGSGGGLPGIPLAICRPAWKLHLMALAWLSLAELSRLVKMLCWLRTTAVRHGRMPLCHCLQMPPQQTTELQISKCPRPEKA
jgi:16S rRNA (guanine527-N7)-methyltransferase